LSLTLWDQTYWVNLHFILLPVYRLLRMLSIVSGTTALEQGTSGNWFTHILTCKKNKWLSLHQVVSETAIWIAVENAAYIIINIFYIKIIVCTRSVLVPSPADGMQFKVLLYTYYILQLINDLSFQAHYLHWRA